MFKIYEYDDLMKTITKVGRDATELQATIHEVGLNCLLQLRNHNQSTPTANLLNALPNGTRVKALAHWFNVNAKGAVNVARDPQSKVWTVQLIKGRTPDMYKMDEAEATSFADLTEEREVAQFDEKALIAWITKKAKSTQRLNDGKPAVSNEAKALAARLLNFLADPTSIKVAVEQGLTEQGLTEQKEAA